MVSPVSTRPRDEVTLANRYQLLRRFGQSRSTESWEAFDARLDRSVLVRLLREGSRHDVGAQEELRWIARQRTLDVHPTAPRVLDGGEDPALGPFVVAELNEQYATTQPLPVLPPSRASGSRGWAGPLMLALLALAIIACAIFFVQLLQTPASGPTAAPTAAPTAPPGRPLSGAQPANQPTAPPTPVPTLAAPRQAAAPTPVPTAAPPPQAAAPAARPTAAATTPPTAAPTSVPANAPASAPTAVPTSRAAGTAAPAASPVDTIRQHYALINAHNYAAGYQLMDSHLQNLNSPSDYAGWFANKVAVQPISIDVVSQADDQATVRSVVSSTDRVNGQDVTSQVTEQFVLRNENGAWRIDQVARLS